MNPYKPKPCILGSHIHSIQTGFGSLILLVIQECESTLTSSPTVSFFDQGFYVKTNSISKTPYDPSCGLSNNVETHLGLVVC